MRKICLGCGKRCRRNNTVLMKRIIAIIVSSVLLNSLCEAQTLEEYMVKMIPSSTQLKSDMISQLLSSYQSNGVPSKVANLYRDTSMLVGYEQGNYALFQLSDQGYVSVKSWRISDTVQVFGFSSWVCGTMCDGWWRFQSVGKKAVPFPSVDVSDFFDMDSLAADGMTVDSLAGRFEMDFLHCEFSKGDSVHVYCDTERYLEMDRRKIYSKYFKGNRISLLPVDGEFKIVAVKRDERFNGIH